LAACQRKRLRFSRFSFTQRTQRKRLRLNGNRALRGKMRIAAGSALHTEFFHIIIANCYSKFIVP